VVEVVLAEMLPQMVVMVVQVVELHMTEQLELAK
jgi:hypothetical protein